MRSLRRLQWAGNPSLQEILEPLNASLRAPVDRLEQRGKIGFSPLPEAVCGDAQRAVMMKAAQAAIFVVS